MRIRQVGAAVFACIGVGLVACSGGVESACGNFFDKALAYGQKCGGLGFLDPNDKADFQKYCDALAAAPGSNDLAGQINTCADQVPSDCNQSLNCRIRGSLADGAGCAASTQCSGGVCNVSGTGNPTSEVTCGKCASYLAVGAACGSGPSCDPDTSQCVNGTCVAYVGQGQSCANAPCSDGLQCDPNTQLCQPYPTKGETCTFTCQWPYVCSGGTCIDAVPENGACPNGDECAPNLVCDSQTMICRKPTTASAGQPCGFVNNEIVDCESGLKCALTSGTSQTCIVPKQQGEACTVGQYECVQYLACIGGTCQVPDLSVCQ
jgi:hypothetical protein